MASLVRDTHLTGMLYHPATNRQVDRLVHSFKQSLIKLLVTKTAFQEYLLRYCHALLDFGVTPNKMLNKRWIKCTGVISSPHTTRHTLRKSAKCQRQDTLASTTYTAVSPCYCYVLYCGPKQTKEPRWVPATTTKVKGSHNVKVTAIPHEQIWQTHGLTKITLHH